MNQLCFRCKGRGYCNRGFCVIRQKIQVQKKFNESAKKDFYGENYNVFVGKFGYPNINVGLLNIDEPKKDVTIDNPLLWSKDEYDINKIINLRSNLINSNFKTKIKGFNDRFMDLVQEISLTDRPVDTEISLEKKPQFKVTFNQDTTPFGPSIKLEKARATENIHIPTKVDKIVNDELKAVEGLTELHKKGFDEYYLTKIFSVGNLGLDANKKLVPTRWSITAVDDTLGKDIINDIKEYNIVDTYQLYFGAYLGNNYLIMLLPEVWSYELFEMLTSNPNSAMHDVENYYGRKGYAMETAGGYYAARFSILQQLKSQKRQATIIALRLVTDDYWAPLGVWVVREAVKKAMNSKPIEFDTKEEMIEYTITLAKKQFNYDLNPTIKSSVLLRSIQTQRKISEY
ncbi:MAG: Nre family DNA repair protein [Candidatus Woesearchaeota archaeon]